MNNVYKTIGVITACVVLTATVADLWVISTPKTDKCIIIHEDITENTVARVKDQYKQLVNKDDVCVDIETNGGLVDAAIEIIVFLDKNTKSTTMIVDKYAHSAGAFIMLSGTYLKISPNAMSVIHIPRLGYYQGALVIDAPYNDAFNRVFLNEGRGAKVLRHRLNEYLNGNDVWLTGSEVVYNLHDLRYAQLSNKRYTYWDNFKFMLIY